MTSAVHVWEDHFVWGTVYRPGNDIARQVLALLNRSAFNSQKLEGLRLLGFEVVMLNERPKPLPHPYARMAVPEPKHIFDEA